MESLYNLGVALVQRDRPGDALPYLERFAHEAPHEHYPRELEDVRWLLAQLRSLDSGEPRDEDTVAPPPTAPLKD